MTRNQVIELSMWNKKSLFYFEKISSIVQKESMKIFAFENVKKKKIKHLINVDGNEDICKQREKHFPLFWMGFHSVPIERLSRKILEMF